MITFIKSKIEKLSFQYFYIIVYHFELTIIDYLILSLILMVLNQSNYTVFNPNSTNHIHKKNAHLNSPHPSFIIRLCKMTSSLFSWLGQEVYTRKNLSI